MIAGTNLHLLASWAAAYCAAGEAALPPFGLSEADIDAVLTVDEAAWRRWAALPLSLVEPRRGLLTALRAGNEHRVHSFVVNGRGPLTTPAIGRLPVPVNGYLLATWRRAATEPEWSRRFALDNDDAAALDGAEDSAIEQWSKLPIALATPKPGLLAGLFEREEPRLVAFLSALQR